MLISTDLANLLQAADIPFRAVEHAAEGSCEAVSALRGNELKQAAKAIVLSGKVSKKGRVYILAVLPADLKVNVDSLVRLYGDLGVKSMNFANADKATVLTGCVMGTVPPFRFADNVAEGDKHLEMVVDPRLFDNDEIVFNACELTQSFFIAATDYKKWIDTDSSIRIHCFGE